MAKKKSHRKHQFKHTAPSRAATTKEQAKPATAAVAVPGGHTEAIPGYVSSDLRRIGLLALAFIGLQVVLWYLFSHTGLGPSVYRLIKP